MLLAEPLQASVRGEGLRAAGVPKGRALAAFALTQQRLVLHLMGDPVVDVTWDSGEARDLELAAVEDGLEIGFSRGGGSVVVLLRLPDPEAVVAAIEQRRRPLDPKRHVRARDGDGDGDR